MIKSIMNYYLLIAIVLLPFAAVAQIDSTGKSVDKKDTAHAIQSVTVSGVVSSQALRQQPVNVAVIDSRPFYNTNLTGTELLRQTSGIKVKQSAGYGSNVEFFINGSTGKQVKYFIDGLPQDNLGETQGLNIIPLEQTERIEVYKGILPVDLGADALGAAINIVTRRERQDYINASYAIGSFNTHRINLSGKHFFSKNFFAGVLAGANYSDNDYKINADVFDQYGNPQPVTAKRFHDAFKNYSTRAEAGWTNTCWADQATVTIVSAGLNRQLQSNMVMTQPYGNAFYKETLWSGIARYAKRNLLKNVDFSAYASYNHVKGLFTDTSKNVYNWYGDVVTRKFSGGEIISSGNELNIYTKVTNGKLTATYRFNDLFKIVFSNTLQHYNRTGKDTVAKAYYGGVDFYSTPSALTKNISGLGVEGKINSKLKFTTSVKYLFARLHSSTLDWSTQTPVSQQMHDVAYNAAVSYRLSEPVLLKTSYEHAVRLPEPEEAFGDLMVIKPNPHLVPEISDNINLNFLYKKNGLNAEVTGFYRNVNNIIYLRPALTSAMYQNLLKARVTGVEAAANYTPVSCLTLTGNITFQDLRNQSYIDGGSINNDRYKNARLPNIPYLFANGGIAYTKKICSKQNTSLQLWYNTTYTHEYFLYWEVDGARELKNRIPMQLLHYTGVSYLLPKRGLSFSFEVNNLANQTTYDNFKAQLPGRSYSLKIRFYKAKNL